MSAPAEARRAWLDRRCPGCAPERETPLLTELDPRGAVPAATACHVCGAVAELRPEGLTAEGGLLACLACGHPELYTQKRFPRALGLSIVALAALAAPFTAYLSLAAAAALDALLYWRAPDEVRCYVCSATHHGFHPQPRHPSFDREIQERLVHGERAVMGRPMRPGGTAGAPEPEH